LGKDILIRLKIPISIEKIVPTPAMIFSKWLPMKEDDFIIKSENDLELKIWFSEKSLGHVADVHKISNHYNLIVDKIFIDISIFNLPVELIKYIRLKSLQKADESKTLESQYSELGRKVYQVALTYYNRLISYVRSERGQFWLQEYPIIEDTSTYHSIKFNAKVKIDSEWFLWYPEESNADKIVVKIGKSSLDYNRFITKENWDESKSFVSSTRRTSLVWELLSGAEWLAGIGHRRSALTEAITALEVAISKFAKHPNVESLLDKQIIARMNIASMKDWIKRAGLSGTLYYLFPLIFTEKQIPIDMLRSCQEAIQERGNVVHNSQRDVKKEKISIFIDSIRNVCQLLESYTFDLS
jgi:hypothetical protein